jgi:hypothetical protein
LWRGESLSQPATSSALLSPPAVVSREVSSSPALPRVTESATLLALAMRQPTLAEERCSPREKTPASEAQRRVSPAWWFEQRDQTEADSELAPAGQVMSSRAHAKALNSPTHAEVSKSVALTAGGCSRFLPGST